MTKYNFCYYKYNVCEFVDVYAESGKLLPKCKTLYITSYCCLNVISNITILLYLKCDALHYFCITFTKITPEV